MSKIIKEKYNIKNAENILDTMGLVLKDVVFEETIINREVRDAFIRSSGQIELLLFNLGIIESNRLINASRGDVGDMHDLFTITILKHSVMYWNNAIIDKNNPWHNFYVAAYVEKSLIFKNSHTKGLFKDIVNGIKNAIESAVVWVGDNINKIATAVIYGASLDYATSVVIPKFTGLGAGPGAIAGCAVGIGITAGASALGTLYGWTNPLWM